MPDPRRVDPERFGERDSPLAHERTDTELLASLWDFVEEEP